MDKPDDPGDRAEGPGEGFMVLVGCGGRWLPEMYLLSRLSKLLEPASSNWRKRQINFIKVLNLISVTT